MIDDVIPVWQRRHPEWQQWREVWRWLLDSWEAGTRYRDAVYGSEHGLPTRNLVRHKREYPLSPAVDAIYVHESGVRIGPDPVRPVPADTSMGDYELRLSRTPVPTFVAEALDDHLAQVYSREVTREGPDELVAWWEDVDGQGTSIDDWMSDVAAPLLLVLGQIDVLLDHPALPEGQTTNLSRSDVERLGLNRCLASVILPENMLWWQTDWLGDYVECLVGEWHEDTTRGTQEYLTRHWTRTGWTLYDSDGKVRSTGTHPYGVVPIVRVFDRKRPRTRWVGRPRYEAVAEKQREYYNRDSELIISDSTQAHPLLQGPEDYVNPDGTIPIGPSWMLPKKKDDSGRPVHYEKFEVVEYPKGSADSIRANKADIREQVDRETKMTRPAGQARQSQGTVEQSGISKHLDMQPAHSLLAKIAKSLRRLELDIAWMALVVLRDGDASTPAEEGVDVAYPTNFDLYTASDVAVAVSDFQLIAGRTNGSMPELEKSQLKRLYSLGFPGRPDAHYEVIYKEIEEFVDSGGGQAIVARQAQDQARLQQSLDPGGNVRQGASDPTPRLQPPGQTGEPGPSSNEGD